jgi:uncharacterized protein YceK
MKFRDVSFISLAAVCLLSGCAYIEGAKAPKDAASVQKARFGAQPPSSAVPNAAGQATKMLTPLRGGPR